MSGVGLRTARLTWTQAIRLKQVKPGPAALPDVKVRFRDGPAAVWQEAEWVDLLTTVRFPAAGTVAAAETAWPPWTGLAAAVLALTAAVWAQGIFLNFKNYMQFARKKPPFGIAQIGKSFRNEITTGNFIFRTREFEQMEIEFSSPRPTPANGTSTGCRSG